MRIWLVALTSLIFLAGCEQSREQVHLSGPTMGTSYNIKYINGDEFPESNEVHTEIDRLLEEVNDQMSTYREDSELSRFNQHRGADAFEVSEQTALVVKEAIRLNGLTEGALDVTVGPLVNLWGFGPEARPEDPGSDLPARGASALRGDPAPLALGADRRARGPRAGLQRAHADPLRACGPRDRPRLLGSVSGGDVLRRDLAGREVNSDGHRVGQIDGAHPLVDRDPHAAVGVGLQ